MRYRVIDRLTYETLFESDSWIEAMLFRTARLVAVVETTE